MIIVRRFIQPTVQGCVVIFRDTVSGINIMLCSSVVLCVCLYVCWGEGDIGVGVGGADELLYI